MALQWKWTDKIGKAVIRQHEREYELNIYDGNALAIFICEYKNKKGEDVYQLYNFISDRKHLENIVKNNHRILSDEVVSVELNNMGQWFYKLPFKVVNSLTKALRWKHHLRD